MMIQTNSGSKVLIKNIKLDEQAGNRLIIVVSLDRDESQNIFTLFEGNCILLVSDGSVCYELSGVAVKTIYLDGAVGVFRAEWSAKVGFIG